MKSYDNCDIHKWYIIIQKMQYLWQNDEQILHFPHILLRTLWHHVLVSEKNVDIMNTCIIF